MTKQLVARIRSVLDRVVKEKPSGIEAELVDIINVVLKQFD